MTFLFKTGADLGFFKHKSNAEGVRHARGVWGHAPRNLESLKCDFKRFGGQILQNSKDYKVRQTHAFL